MKAQAQKRGSEDCLAQAQVIQYRLRQRDQPRYEASRKQACRPAATALSANLPELTLVGSDRFKSCTCKESTDLAKESKLPIQRPEPARTPHNSYPLYLNINHKNPPGKEKEIKDWKWQKSSQQAKEKGAQVQAGAGRQVHLNRACRRHRE